MEVHLHHTLLECTFIPGYVVVHLHHILLRRVFIQEYLHHTLIERAFIKGYVVSIFIVPVTVSCRKFKRALREKA